MKDIQPQQPIIQKITTKEFSVFDQWPHSPCFVSLCDIIMSSITESCQVMCSFVSADPKGNCIETYGENRIITFYSLLIPNGRNASVITSYVTQGMRKHLTSAAIRILLFFVRIRMRLNDNIVLKTEQNFSCRQQCCQNDPCLHGSVKTTKQ